MWSLVGLRKHHYEQSSGGDGIPVELFQILKYDAVKVLHSISQQIWKAQQWPQDWKRSVFIPIQKKGNCSNYCKITLISQCGRTQVPSLAQEDPLEREMATHSSTLAWKIPWTEECGKLQSMGSQRVEPDWATLLTHSLTHSHARKVMLKIPQARLQHYVNHEFLMFKLYLEKAEEREIKLLASVGSSKKPENSRKTTISALLTVPKS